MKNLVYWLAKSKLGTWSIATINEISIKLFYHKPFREKVELKPSGVKKRIIPEDYVNRKHDRWSDEPRVTQA
jgi:hypothetical protein